MSDERRIRTRTPEGRTIYARIQVAMEPTSRLNVPPFSDIDSRKALLSPKDVPPLTVVPSAGYVERKHLEPVSSSEV